MLTLHGPGSDSTVEQIIQRKVSLGEFKEHPDLPDCPDATLFYVLLDLDRCEQDEREERVSLRWTGEMDGATQARTWFLLFFLIHLSQKVTHSRSQTNVYESTSIKQIEKAVAFPTRCI